MITIHINTNLIQCEENLINRQIYICTPTTTKIKNLRNEIISKLSFDKNIILGHNFQKNLHLYNNNNDLNNDFYNKKISDICNTNDINCFDIALTDRSFIPICIQIKNTNKKFIFLNNEIIRNVIRFMSKYVDLINCNLMFLNKDLKSRENINKDLQILGFSNCYINILEIKSIIDLTTIIVHKKQSISESKKTDVWNTYVGEDIGISMCKCCKIKQISSRRFHVGHVIAESKGGTLDIYNLRPICDKCNLSMGTKNMNDYMERNQYGKLDSIDTVNMEID